MTKSAAADDALLTKLNEAVAEVNKAEKVVTTAQAELVSKSKIVGQLLLEARKRHPKVVEFEAFLKRVNGLKLSRAYDLMRLAGGRITDEQLRQESRERVRKHRAKKKLPKPTPEPVSVTDPHVTESPEIGLDQRKAEMAALDKTTDDTTVEEHLDPTPEKKQSARCLNEFKIACRTYLPKLTENDWFKAVLFAQDTRAAAKKAKAA
jgi:hypothetical protein